MTNWAGAKPSRTLSEWTSQRNDEDAIDQYGLITSPQCGGARCYHQRGHNENAISMQIRQGGGVTVLGDGVRHPSMPLSHAGGRFTDDQNVM